MSLISPDARAQFSKDYLSAIQKHGNPWTVDSPPPCIPNPTRKQQHDFEKQVRLAYLKIQAKKEAYDEPLEPPPKEEKEPTSGTTTESDSSSSDDDCPLKCPQCVLRDLVKLSFKMRTRLAATETKLIKCRRALRNADDEDKEFFKSIVAIFSMKVATLITIVGDLNDTLGF